MGGQLISLHSKESKGLPSSTFHDQPRITQSSQTGSPTSPVGKVLEKTRNPSEKFLGERRRWQWVRDRWNIFHLRDRQVTRQTWDLSGDLLPVYPLD